MRRVCAGEKLVPMIWVCVAVSNVGGYTVIWKGLRPDMILKLSRFYAMTSDYLISCFYCIIQFGLKKNIRKERGRFRQRVRKQQQYRNKQTKKHKQQQTQTKTNI